MSIRSDDLDAAAFRQPFRDQNTGVPFAYCHKIPPSGGEFLRSTGVADYGALVGQPGRDRGHDKKNETARGEFADITSRGRPCAAKPLKIRPIADDLRRRRHLAQSDGGYGWTLIAPTIDRPAGRLS